MTDSIQFHLPFDAPVDVTDARCGQVLNEKQPTANQYDKRLFFQVGATRRR
jgi:hypothetical protein